MSGLRRIRRGEHWLIGRFVVVQFCAFDAGRYQWTESLFPVNQSRALHPRHPTGFDLVSGERNACVAPSCSFYGELCRYAGFRWGSA
jgi:hypothetical protein